MNEIRRITITGNNWNDIIALPCVIEITKERILGKVRTLAVLYWDSLLTDKVGCCAYIGDSIVQYENGKWGIIEDKTS